MLTETEIEHRLPVWHALSDFFLDTELQPEDHARIAASLRASGLSRLELHTIFSDEVAPAFIFNLMSIAGEWCSWSTEQVREIMLDSLSPTCELAPIPWLKRRMYRRFIADTWQKIEQLLDESL